uniref:Uncharacterized protein n=1 Tax=Megaselia scalaris TaxID=36166 RepID=T1GIQ1_MEGSC
MKFLLSFVIAVLAVAAPTSATFDLLNALKSEGVGSYGNGYGYSGYGGYSNGYGYGGYNNGADVKVVKVYSYPSSGYSSGYGYSNYGQPAYGAGYARSSAVISTPVVSTPVVSTPVVYSSVVSTPVIKTAVATPLVSTYQAGYGGLGAGYGSGYNYGIGSGYGLGSGYGSGRINQGVILDSKLKWDKHLGSDAKNCKMVKLFGY